MLADPALVFVSACSASPKPQHPINLELVPHPEVG